MSIVVHLYAIRHPCNLWHLYNTRFMRFLFLFLLHLCLIHLIACAFTSLRLCTLLFVISNYRRVYACSYSGRIDWNGSGTRRTRHIQGTYNHIIIEGNRHTVVIYRHRIHRSQDLIHPFDICRTSYCIIILYSEVSVEIYKEQLIHKSLTTVRHVPGLKTTVGNILKLFSVPHIKKHLSLVGTRFQSTRVS